MLRREPRFILVLLLVGWVVFSAPAQSRAWPWPSQKKILLDPDCEKNLVNSEAVSAPVKRPLQKWENIRTFDENSLALVEPGVTFTEEEIRQSMEYLKKAGYKHTVTLEYVNGEFKRFSLRNVGDSFVNPLPGAVLQKLHIVAEKTRNLYKRTRGTEPGRVELAFRATSVLDAGSSDIRPDGDRTDRDGFHVHDKEPEWNIDLVWAIDGKGVRLKLPDGSIRIVPEGLVALMGTDVPHGSPYSEDFRLIVVGLIGDAPR